MSLYRRNGCLGNPVTRATPLALPTSTKPFLPARLFSLPALTLALIVGVLALLMSGCSGGDNPAGGVGSNAPPPAVTVVQLQPEPITTSARFVGRIVAAEKVELRARIQGFLQERDFAEGQFVTAGTRLFLIEDDAYRVQVVQREADLARAQAEFTNAQAQLRRNEELLRSNDIPRARVDELRAAQAVAQAGIAQAEAALQAAQLNLQYTTIHAPISGRIGLSRYSVGNLVGPESGPLATLVQQDPIQVHFPLNQRDLLAHRQVAHQRGADPGAVTVYLRLPDGSRYPHAGVVDFVDVVVDPGTDTVLVRAPFPNPDGWLVSGQYATIEIEADTPEQGLLLPQAALQLDQAGAFALVLDAADTVQVRRITLGSAVGARFVIPQGLAPGDRVIVEGIQKVRPGQTVTATPWQAMTQE